MLPFPCGALPAEVASDVTDEIPPEYTTPAGTQGRLDSGMLDLLLLILGLVALVGGAELLVRGSVGLAGRLGISPLVVGLTIVAFGTSSPELFVSVRAGLAGQSELALANVLGSNIFNVLAILGIAALVAPLAVHRSVVRRDIPIMFGASLLAAALLLDGQLGRLEGGVLVALLAIYTGWLIVASRSAPAGNEPPPKAMKPLAALAFIGLGLGGCVLGSTLLVDGAVGIATWLGISERAIGLTIVAAGTSLPELATSITAAFRGQRDIAVGNVVGSNAFNLLGILGASALVTPMADLPPGTRVDLLVMIVSAGVCLPLCAKLRINRWEGAAFVIAYAGYLAYLLSTQRG